MRSKIGLAAYKVNRADSIAVVAVAVISIFTNLAYGVGVGVAFSALMFAWDYGKEIEIVKDGSGNVVFQDSPKKFEELESELQEAAKKLDIDSAKWNAALPDPADSRVPTRCLPKDFPKFQGDPKSSAFKEYEAKIAAYQTLGYTEKNWSLTTDMMQQRTYKIKGTQFFGSARVFQALFTAEFIDSCPHTTILDMSRSEIRDFSAMEGLRGLKALYKDRGKKLKMINITDKSDFLLKKGVAHLDGMEYVNEEVADGLMDTGMGLFNNMSNYEWAGYDEKAKTN